MVRDNFTENQELVLISKCTFGSDTNILRLFETETGLIVALILSQNSFVCEGNQ